MRAVGYIRVSSESQVDGNSLAAQERLFYELCKSRDWQPVAVYREEGKSAHSESIRHRPAFRQILEDASKRKFDNVVVHTLDRWSRNLRITLESLKTLAQHDVGLVSITENIDYSTAQGKLFTQMLGSFAEYFSESLATHVKKGQSERARSGRHLGGIPFGYRSCWSGKDGSRILSCEDEHPGGVHQVPEETEAIKQLFRQYASGRTSTSDLAIWINEQGFRTRNTKPLPGRDGSESAGPRFFTNASIRNILHNRFYAGSVKHGKHHLPGDHEPIITEELFESVQLALSKNSGRSATTGKRQTRTYLLKGLARCTDCGMNLWAQTYRNGQRYYREQRASRSHGLCPSQGGSIRCELPDEKVNEIFSSLSLPVDWERRALQKINARDEVARINDERDRAKEKLQRLGMAFVDGMYEEGQYRQMKQALNTQIESLVVPEIDAAREAGALLGNMPRLWSQASMVERHSLLTTVVDAVFLDFDDPARVDIKLKPVFEVLLP